MDRGDDLAGESVREPRKGRGCARGRGNRREGQDRGGDARGGGENAQVPNPTEG